MAMGLFGKLPARGDFVSYGMPPEMLHQWENWLAAVTAAAARQGDWGDATGGWDAGPVLRFWIGPDQPGGARAGVFRPSHDRVGRRFPLTILWYGPAEEAPAAPVMPGGAAAEGWYAALAAAADRMCDAGFAGEIGDVLAALPEPPPTGLEAAPRSAFFAEGTAGAEALFADVARHDHLLAAAGRSYWWVEEARDGPAAALALVGLPDGAGLTALINATAPVGAAADPWAGSTPAASPGGPPPAPAGPAPAPAPAAGVERASRDFGSDDETPF